jgi:hypothetical protein
MLVLMGLSGWAGSVPVGSSHPNTPPDPFVDQFSGYVRRECL